MYLSHTVCSPGLRCLKNLWNWCLQKGQWCHVNKSAKSSGEYFPRETYTASRIHWDTWLQDMQRWCCWQEQNGGLSKLQDCEDVDPELERSWGDHSTPRQGRRPGTDALWSGNPAQRLQGTQAVDSSQWAGSDSRRHEKMPAERICVQKKIPRQSETWRRKHLSRQT